MNLTRSSNASKRFGAYINRILTDSTKGCTDLTFPDQPPSIGATGSPSHTNSSSILCCQGYPPLVHHVACRPTRPAPSLIKEIESRDSVGTNSRPHCIIDRQPEPRPRHDKQASSRTIVLRTPRFITTLPCVPSHLVNPPSSNAAVLRAQIDRCNGFAGDTTG